MLTKEELRELEELKNDPKLKKAKKKLYDKEKQRLYQLRWLKKKAEELEKQGLI